MAGHVLPGCLDRCHGESLDQSLAVRSPQSRDVRHKCRRRDPPGLQHAGRARASDDRSVVIAAGNSHMDGDPRHRVAAEIPPARVRLAALSRRSRRPRRRARVVPAPQRDTLRDVRVIHVAPAPRRSLTRHACGRPRSWPSDRTSRRASRPQLQVQRRMLLPERPRKLWKTMRSSAVPDQLVTACTKSALKRKRSPVRGLTSRYSVVARSSSAYG